THFLGIRLELVALSQLERHRHSAEGMRNGCVSRKPRIGIEHLVSRLDQGHHRHKESNFASRRDDDVLRVYRNIACIPQILSYSLAQRRNSYDWTVAVLAGIQGVLERLNNIGGGMEIWLAQLKVNDRTPGGLQFFGARKYRERAFAAHHADARSWLAHVTPSSRPGLAPGWWESAERQQSG